MLSVVKVRGHGQPKISAWKHCLLMNIFNYLVPVAVGAVLLVLLLGLWNMMRGGPGNRSQLLMRWRVVLQFIAIIIIMTAIWFTHSH